MTSILYKEENETLNILHTFLHPVTKAKFNLIYNGIKEELILLPDISLNIDLGMNYFVTENMAISFGLSNVLSYGTATAETPGPAGAETQVSGLNGNFNVFQNFFDTPTFGLTYKF